MEYSLPRNTAFRSFNFIKFVRHNYQSSSHAFLAPAKTVMTWLWGLGGVCYALGRMSHQMFQRLNLSVLFVTGGRINNFPSFRVDYSAQLVRKYIFIQTLLPSSRPNTATRTTTNTHYNTHTSPHTLQHTLDLQTSKDMD